MTILAEALLRARSLLAVPGHRPDRFSKAVKSGADAIMLDLEDAVGPDSKAVARENIRDWLSSGGTGIIRINDIRTRWYEEDVAMLNGRQCVVMLPKVAESVHITDLLDRLGHGSCVVALIETAEGILNARDICSTEGVVRAVFGNGDLASELGIDHGDRTALAQARSQIVISSAACGLTPPIDGLTTALNDEERLLADARHAAAMGFTGKVCIHPCQIPIVHAMFTPSREKLRWAEDVLAASADGCVALLDGQVIGTPILNRARRLLSQWGSNSSTIQPKD